MRAILLIYVIVIHCVLLRTQSFTGLNSINQSRYTTACFDGKGRLLAGYPSNGNFQNDSFYFDRYDFVTKQWTYKLHELYTKYEWDEFYNNRHYCVAIEDTVYLRIFRQYSLGNDRIYRITGSSHTLIAQIHGANEFIIENQMTVSNGRLHLCGDMDSIDSQNLGTHVYWEGGQWVSAYSPVKTKKGTPGLAGFALSGDSGIFIGNNNNQYTVYIWSYPDKWDTLQLNSRFEKVYRMHNAFVFAKRNSTDSLFYLKGSNYFGVKMDNPVNCDYALETEKGVLFYNFKSKNFNGGSEPFYLYDPSTGSVGPVFECKKGYNMQLISKDTNAVFILNQSIEYYNRNLGTIASINLQRLKEFAYDTVIVRVYFDKNEDGDLNGNDEYPIVCRIKNTNTGSVKTQYLNGIFIEYFPDYTDYEYELLDYDINACVSRKYHYALKAHLTDSGKSRYILDFPIRNGSNGKNVSLRGASLHQARLNDTTEIVFNIMNTECDSIKTINGQLELVLEKGTLLQNSSPAYSYKRGDTLGYSGFQVPAKGKTQIKLKVIYSNSNFSINNKVKHTLYLTDNRDTFFNDNMDSVVQTLVYSYDPNIKHCSPNGKVMHEVDRVRYHIQFQNEGNDEARNVRIADTLDERFDLYDINISEASHQFRHIMNNNVLEFVFDEINLKPKAENEAESRGYIIFELKLKQALKEFDSISNKAYIYFDDNQPVITNQARLERIPYKWIPRPLNLKASFEKQIQCRTIQLTNTSKDAIAYNWYFGDGFTSTQEAPEHIYTKNGMYSLKLIVKGYDSLSSTYKYDTAISQIEISCIICEPLKGFDYWQDSLNCKKIHFNQTITGDSISIKWVSGSYTATGLNADIVYPQAGKYNVRREATYYNTTYYNWCKDTFDGQIEFECSTSISKLGYTFEVGHVYPNPASTIIYVLNPSDNSHIYKIYNTEGRLIKEVDIEGGESSSIDISMLAAGLYIIMRDDGQYLPVIIE